MLEYHIRHYYQTVFATPIAKCIQTFTNPNMITLFACLSGIAVIPALAKHNIGLALILLLLSGVLDTLDGTVARLKNQTSNVGTMLDIIADRIVEASVIIGLYLYAPEHRALGCLLLLSSIYICVTCFLVAGIFIKNESTKGFHYNTALIERFEAFIFFALMLCLPQHFNLLSTALSLLIILTAIQHCIKIFAYETKNK